MASEVMPSGACANTGPAAAQPPQRPSVTRIGSASIWRSAWSARRPVCVSTHSKHNPVGRAARISRMVAMTNRSRHRRRGCIGLWSNGVSVLPSDRSSGPSSARRREPHPGATDGDGVRDPVRARRKQSWVGQVPHSHSLLRGVGVRAPQRLMLRHEWLTEGPMASGVTPAHPTDHG